MRWPSRCCWPGSPCGRANTALPLYQDETYHLRRAEAVYRFADNPIAYAHGKLLLYYWIGAFDPAYTEAGLATARLSVALTGLSRRRGARPWRGRCSGEVRRCWHSL